MACRIAAALGARRPRDRRRARPACSTIAANRFRCSTPTGIDAGHRAAARRRPEWSPSCPRAAPRCSKASPASASSTAEGLDAQARRRRCAGHDAGAESEPRTQFGNPREHMTTTRRQTDIQDAGISSTCCRPTSGSPWCSSAATACACSTIRARVSGFRVGHRRGVAGTRASGAGARDWPIRRRRSLHTSNLYFHPLQGELAARLSALTGLERAFFCNSGTEANEACLKFARRYWHTRGETIAHEVTSRSRTRSMAAPWARCR